MDKQDDVNEVVVIDNVEGKDTNLSDSIIDTKEDNIVERYFKNLEYPQQIEGLWSVTDEWFFDMIYDELVKSTKPSINDVRKEYKQHEKWLIEDGGSIESSVRQKYLALLILRCEELVQSEKEEIYLILTGENISYPNQGAPSRIGRDTIMAMEFMCRIYKGGKPKTVTSDMQDTYGIDKSNNTFRTAIEKGKRNIGSAVDKWKHEIEKNNAVNLKDINIECSAKTILKNFGIDQIEIILDKFPLKKF